MSMGVLEMSTRLERYSSRETKTFWLVFFEILDNVQPVTQPQKPLIILPKVLGMREKSTITVGTKA